MSKRKEPYFGYLLASLILFLIVGPVATGLFGEADGLILLLTLNGTLLIGIFSLQRNRILFVSGIVLALLSVAITVADSMMKDDSLELFSVAVLLAFLLLSAGVALKHLIAPGGISFNRLMGGACIYIMLGMIWTVLYAFLDWADPDAFSGALATGSTLGKENTAFWDLMYFSFVTMPALGYGDITPVAPLARVLAYLQAVVGQLFIAMLIGSLVGAYVSSNRSGKTDMDS